MKKLYISASTCIKFAIFYTCCSTMAHAAVCSVTAIKEDGTQTVYYRSVGKPTKYLTGVIATIKPCNAEKLAINPTSCPVCQACLKCAGNKWGGSQVVPALPNGECMAEVTAVYSATVVVDKLTGERKCSLE